MKEYVNPEVEVVEIDDVIVTSPIDGGTGGGSELPPLPFGDFNGFESVETK